MRRSVIRAFYRSESRDLCKTRWHWWKAPSPLGCGGLCCRSQDTRWAPGTRKPACRSSWSSRTGRRRWWGSQTSCCRPSSEPPSWTRRRPGSGGRSQTPPTGGRCDEAARTGRRPRPPRGPSEPSVGEGGWWVMSESLFAKKQGPLWKTHLLDTSCCSTCVCH